MSLKELQLRSSYETEEDRQHLLDNFYIPVLEQAVKYYRIAGFFSSTALAIAAKGIEGLIKNNGKMYLLISPVLSQADFDTIKEHGTIPDQADMFSDLELDSAIDENIQALAWLLDAGRLEIKIVIPTKNRDSIFHQKVGIIFDNENNVISFSGSINESAKAWLENIEEFKLFRSWEVGQLEYLQSDLDKFLKYWKNQKTALAHVYDIPEAIREKIVKIRPKNVNDLKIMRRYRQDAKVESNGLDLFPHQKQAVSQWINNRFALLMEMATGTGKTRTALGCLVEILKNKERMLVIIATPQNTLSRQWLIDFNNLRITVDSTAIIDGSNSRWRKELELLLLDLSDDKIRTAVIFTTHDTASSQKFINIIQANKFDTKILFICDEVHAIGSTEQRKAMLDIYEYRVGLSATPERMFDESGTSLIREYFGARSFEFTIADALATINPRTGSPFLNRFEYHPIFIELTPEELRNYNKISKQIAILKSKDDCNEDDLQKLYGKRANIGKNALNKYSAFEELIQELNPATITDTLCFVSDKQIVRVFEILTKYKIKRAKITENESASKIVNSAGETERQELITQFKKRIMQVLVGEKCLDEGIDITNARIAILMSSSTNPREYVQRVGRVIRPYPGKQVSLIYDFIVTSGSKESDSIIEKEARRAAHIAKNATNFDEVKKSFEMYGVSIDAD